MTSEKRGKKNFVEKNSITSPHCPAYHFFFIQRQRVSLCNLRQVQRKSVHANICTYIHIQRDSAN